MLLTLILLACQPEPADDSSAPGPDTATPADSGDTNDTDTSDTSDTGSGAPAQLAQASLVAADPLAGALFGLSVAAGDHDGDGFADVVVGGPYDDEIDTAAGAIWLYPGSAGGADPAGQKFTIDNLPSYGLLGLGVSTADVDGDGYDDLLAGAPFDDHGGSHTGAVYVFYGSQYGIYTERTEWILADEARGELSFYGYAVAGLGDVDGDGYDDVLIGAPSDEGAADEAGAAYLHYGADGGLSDTRYERFVAPDAQADAWFGQAVAAAGDLNGDGHPDALINAYKTDSEADIATYALYGGANRARLVKIDAPNTAEDFGREVAGAGDIDGDGYDDALIVDRSPADASGAVYVLYGSADDIGGRWERLDSVEEDDAFGRAVAGAGDVDGDGYGDVLVGADGASDDTGAVYVYYGGPDGIDGDRLDTIAADDAEPDAHFGGAVAGADVNGDGAPDAIVGAAGATVAGVKDAGAVYVHYSPAP